MLDVDPGDLPRLYAMRTVGTCLEPVVKEGELLLFDKDYPCRGGDYAVIFLRPEKVPEGHCQGLVKRLRFGIPRSLRLPYKPAPESNLAPIIVGETLNPPTALLFEAEDVLAVHRCIGIVEGEGGFADPDRIRLIGGEHG